MRWPSFVQAEPRKRFDLAREYAVKNQPRNIGKSLGEYFEDVLERMGGLKRMDGAYYQDTREPFIFADVTAVTLAATQKALYPASNFPVLGGQYFARPGKRMHITMMGRATTGITPGNLTLGSFYGTGADANGVSLVTSAAVALIASQTNLTWCLDFHVHCRSVGNTGTLFAWGQFGCNPALIASTAQPVMMPASAPAVSGACDLTAALIISLQALRSGSTAETMQVHDLKVVSPN